MVDTRLLKRLILEKYPTQIAFAEAVGTSKQYVNGVLSGRIEPSLAMAARLAEALDVRVDDLLKKSVAVAA